MFAKKENWGLILFEMEARTTGKHGTRGGAVGVGRTINFDKELSRVDVRDGTGIVGSKVAGSPRVTNFAATIVTS